MVKSADEARQRAAKAAALLRLVNEAAAGPLVRASDAGETCAVVDFAPIRVPASGARGRVHDRALVDFLEAQKLDVLALGCRRFIALGFAVSSVLQDDEAGRAESLYSSSPELILSHLLLDYSRAVSPTTGQGGPITLQASGIALPAAHHWRARAETAYAIRQHEACALACIAEHAEQGATRCLVAWRELTRDPVVPEQLARLADMLRTRGFEVESSESTLRVRW
jgi:hypothetical protein